MNQVCVLQKKMSVVVRHSFRQILLEEVLLEELNSDEARQFFAMFIKVRLTLTMVYNREANGKIEHNHGLIVKALVKLCDERMKL
jgi:hypothetical protein